MSRNIHVRLRRALGLRSALGFGLLVLLAAVLLVDPGDLGALLRDAALQPVMLLGLLLALAFACMQAVAAMRLREQPRPVPVRTRTGSHRLPR